MSRYIAVDNTSAAAYAGWELMDTEAIPPRTFAIAMPEADAKFAARAMNAACHCDRNNIGEPGVSCGDCPNRDYKPARDPAADRQMLLDALKGIEKTALCDHWLGINETRRRYAIARDARIAIERSEGIRPEAPARATPQVQADIAYLLEAYRYGQFADDMFDHPSADCRSPCKPLREALRRHLDWLESSTIKEAS